MQDILIYNGRIADGTGSPAYWGGVAVKNGIITAVGDVSGFDAKEKLDAKGHIIAPGFIDAHCHSDLSFLHDNRCESRIYQGITTEVCGQCGQTFFPSLPENVGLLSTRLELPDQEEWAALSFCDFLNHVEKSGRTMSTNLCQMIGHSAVRVGVMGYVNRKPDKNELDLMRKLLDRELTCGAYGLSLGLEYTPGCFTELEELISLAEVVKTHNGIVTVHMRSEGDFVMQAVEEVISIGRASGAHVHISHLKIDRPVAWGKADLVWSLIKEARASGINISADVYPYNASNTGITNRCPKWAIEGGVENAAKVLRGERRQELLDYLATRFPDENWAKQCLITSTYGLFPEAEGRTLFALAGILNLPYAETAAELILRCHGHADCIFFTMADEDVDFFLRQDTGICSDGRGWSFDPKLVGGKPHPRNYGALVRFLRLVREESICTIEEAVRRVTSKAADMIGLTDRGRLQKGLAADMTVFDPENIADRATYLDPFQKPVGIDFVVVNGVLAFDGQEQTEARAGKFLLHENEA